MRYAFISFVLLLLPVITLAQKEDNNWYFGNKYGITFNTKDTLPVRVYDGQMVSFGESCATFSDAEGNLLFYTDSDTVWNRKNQPMKNINKSQNFYSSFITFPKPGSAYEYYMFYFADNNSLLFALKYSTVDMRLDNGLGGLKEIGITIDMGFSSITAINHSNGIDVWIVAYKPFTKSFYSYKVTKNKISSLPVICPANSNLKFFIHSDILQFISGYHFLRATSAGDKIIALAYNDRADLYTFNTENGTLTFDCTVDTTVNEWGHTSAEFSESGKKLYIYHPGSYEWHISSDYLFQYDISLIDSTIIANTKSVINKDHFPRASHIAMRRGPNGKIFFENSFRVEQNAFSNIGCIEYPELSGEACNVINDMIVIKANSISNQDGFQHILPCYYCLWAEGNSPCEGDTIYLKGNISKRFTDPKFFWTGPDDFTSTEREPVIPGANIANTGLYRLRVIASDSDSTLLADSVFIEVRQRPEAVILTSGDDICKTGNIKLSSKTRNKEYMYLWSTGQTTRDINVSKPGAYTLTVTDDYGCPSSTTINVEGIEGLSIESGGASSLCAGDTVELFVRPENPEYKYEWSTGETTPNISVTTAGEYRVIVTYFRCSDTLTMMIDSLMKYPPAITGADSSCAGSEETYTTAGQDGYLYQWEINGGSAQTPVDEESVVVKWGTQGTGTIIVSAEDTGTGCTGYDTLLVNIDEVLKPEITPPTAAICDGGSVKLKAAGGYARYVWNTGDTTEAITVSQSGSYYVTVKSAGGCESVSDIVNVAEGGNPVFAIEGSTEVCSGDTSIIRTDKEFSSYLWSTGETTREIRITKGGRYSVTVTDSNSCTAGDDIDIIEKATVLALAQDLDFGTVCSGELVGKSIEISNVGKDTVQIDDISFKNSTTPFSAQQESYIIIPSQLSNIDILFDPGKIGKYEDTILIHVAQPCEATYLVHVTGISKARTIAWLPDTVLNIGDNIQIPFMMETTCGILPNDAEYDTDVRFDVSLMKPETVQPAGVIDMGTRSAFRIFNIKGRNPASFMGQIMLAAKDTTTLEISRMDWNYKDFIESDIKNGSVNIEGLCRQNISRIRVIRGLDLSIQPNPVTDEANLIVTGDKNGRVIIAIYTTEGMKKAAFEYEKTTWQMEASINLKDYSSGIYRIVM